MLRSSCGRLALCLALLVALIGLASSTSAQQVLRCEDVVDSALDHHPRIERAIARAAAAASREDAASGAFDPLLQLDGRATPVGPYEDYEASAVISALTPLRGLRVEAGYRYHSGEVPSYYGYRETGSAGELSFSASLPLLEGGGLDEARFGRAMARIGAQRAALDEELARIDVANRAARAWLDWLSAQRVVTVRERLVEIARTRFRNLQRQQELGASAPVDVVEAESNLLGRERNLVDAQRTLQNAAVRLAFWLRQPDGDMMTDVDFALTVPSREVELQESREVSRPDVVDRRMRREELLLDRALARQERLPELDIRAFTYADIGEQIPDSERVYAGVGASFEAPLGNRRARGRVAAAESELVALDAELRQLEESIEIDLQSIRVTYEQARRRVELLARQVELLAELERAERRAWELGESTLFVVNLRELALGDAEVALILAEQELWSAVLSDVATRGGVQLCDALGGGQ